MALSEATSGALSKLVQPPTPAATRAATPHTPLTLCLVLLQRAAPPTECVPRHFGVDLLPSVTHKHGRCLIRCAHLATLALDA
jgi:hypothetical protein